MSQAKDSGVGQQERRRALVDATMTAIAEQGFSNLTLARIAGLAGLTAGIVNFYFTSKEALLLETLKSVAEEFEQTVYAAMDAAPGSPAEQLQAIVFASLDPGITEPRKVAVWYAFGAEARARQDYQVICGHRDATYFARIQALCVAIVAQAGPGVRVSASAIAHALCGLIDEFWQWILYQGPQFDRVAAREQCKAFLASVFPWAYEFPDHAPGSVVGAAPAPYALRRATASDLPEVARLFDLYRQFYQQEPDRAGALAFLGKLIEDEASVVFLAEDSDGRALGFTQLYPAVCSVAMGRYWVLYDLYVERSARRSGVARALMQRASQHAEETGALRIDLETARDNLAGQRLYEQLGYVRDQQFHKYSLPIS